MIEFWKNISSTGIYEALTEKEKRTIRLLNQIVMLAMILQIGGVLALFLKFRLEFVFISIAPIPLYLALFYFQKNRKYKTARWLLLIFSGLIITVFNFLFGPLLNAVIAFFGIAPLVLIFFEGRSERIFLFTYILLSFVVCTWSNFYFTAPFADYVLPIVPSYSFLVVMIAVIAIFRLYEQERKQTEENQLALFQQLKEQNEELEYKQKQIEQQNQKLEKNNEELERFAYIASHDLKTPLRNVSSYLSLIQLKLKETKDDQLNSYLNTAVKGAKQMYHTIENVLEYSRVKDIQEEKQPIDLNDIIQTVLFNLENFIQKRNAIIEYPKLPSIVGNMQQMVSLFQNLIENGIKYNHSEIPRIKVYLEEESSHFTIGIQDNGLGIAHKYRKQIFEIFKRLHPEDEYEGAGVGLAICKKIVENHDGMIWVGSNEEQGALFLIRFPRSSAKKQENEKYISTSI